MRKIAKKECGHIRGVDIPFLMCKNIEEAMEKLTCQNFQQVQKEINRNVEKNTSPIEKIFKYLKKISSEIKKKDKNKEGKC